MNRDEFKANLEKYRKGELSANEEETFEDELEKKDSQTEPIISVFSDGASIADYIFASDSNSYECGFGYHLLKV